MIRKYQVAIILINYNSSDYTIGCVGSIFKMTAPNLGQQIIIVDNNSRDDEFVKLEVLRNQDHVQIHRSRLNVGFSGANMMGMQIADAHYYFFLNNDTLLLNDCSTVFFNFLETNRTAALCSGEMRDSTGSFSCNYGNFPSVALKLFGSGTLRIFNPARFKSRHQKPETPSRVDFVNGSAMFIRAESFESIGGFDTNYFLYCEEEDIAFRLLRAGYETWWLPDAVYQHFISRSSESSNSIRLPFLKEFFISFFYFQRKNYGSAQALILQLLFFFKNIRKFYKNTDYVKLAVFILAGAPMRASLRFQQKINPESAYQSVSPAPTDRSRP